MPPGFKGCRFNVAPHIDQKQMFQTVFNRLQIGGCGGLCPKGGSHDS